MLLLVVYYCAQRGVFQGKASGDGWFGFQYLRAIVWFHTIDMKEPLPQYLPFFGQFGPGHHMPNRCPFGPVFVWMPLYLLACAIQGLCELLKLAPPGRGQSPFEAWVTAVGTLAGVLVGWRYTYVLVERWCGRVAARVGSIAAVWATPIVWYAVTQPLYQHGLAYCFVAILVERWDATRGSPSWRRMVTLGLVGGVAMMMRPQEALWLLLPGGEALLQVVRGPDRRRWLVAGIWLTASTIVAFAPQMAVWYYYTGNPLLPAQAEPLRPTTPFFVVTLFSTRGGLFPWSPVSYAAVAGLFFCRRARTTTLAMLAVFALEVYVVSSAWVITGGYGYGARRLSDGAVLIALSLGLLWVRLDSVRWRSPAAGMGPRQRFLRLAHRLLAGFVAFCVLLNVVTMELLRWKVIASSGAYARSAERFLDDVHAPAPLARWFGVVGYPFVQPAGWLFALRHRVRPSMFETVVGNWYLDRDGQWFQIQSRALPFDTSARSFVVEGIEVADKPPAKVTGPARLLLPMFAKEPIVVHLIARVPPGARAAAWNGVAVPVTDEMTGVRLSVPVEAMRAGTNELTLTLPPGTLLARIEFDATTEWWKPKKK